MITNIILIAIAIISFAGLVLQLRQSFKRATKHVDNSDHIASIVVRIEREIANCTEYTQLLACEDMIKHTLIDRYEIDIIRDHLRDLTNKLQIQRFTIQMDVATVSHRAIIREMDVEELECLIQTLPISEAESINLCMTQYKQITGHEYEL